MMDSEQRARELLATEAAEAGWPRWAAAIREGRTDSIDAITIKAISRALEQREAGSKGREGVDAKLDAWLEATKGLAFIQREDMPLAMKAVQINGPVTGEWVRLDDAIEHAENIRALAAAPSGGAE